MKKLIKLLLISLLLSFTTGWAANTLTILPISPLPAQVVQNTTISNIIYQVKNNSTTNTYNTTIIDLNQQGMTYTTTCGALAPNTTCQINITFNASSSNVPLGPYIHWFGVKGAPTIAGKTLTSTIIPGSSTVTPNISITLSNTGVTTSDTFNVTLTQQGGIPYVCNGLTLGSTAFCEAIPQGQYTVHVAPSTVTGSDSNTYNAPSDFSANITVNGQIISLVYLQNTTTAVSTNMTAPNLAVSGLNVSMAGPGGTTTNPVQPGTHFFANLQAGQYTVTAPNYVGTDSNTYVAQLNNPYTITGGSQIIAIPYVEQPPSSFYNWQISHLTNLASANVFLIDWGGGSTTAPVYIGTNPEPNPLLNSTIESYETGTPTPIGEHAAVQNFPSYIAMGTVTQATDSVTTQLQSQLLDSSFHYEGNGSGNRGCAWDNSAGYNVQMTGSSGSIGTLAAGTYNIIAGWYQYNSGGQPNYYKGALTITNPSSGNYNVDVSYAVTTSAITQLPDLGLVKQYTFPAGAVVTYTVEGPNLGSAISAPHINLNVDGLCYADWYQGGSYTPEVSAMAAQAVAVKGVNSHTLIASEVFYTIDMSDGTSAIYDDTQNDYVLIYHLYNLMYEAQLMQAEEQAGTPMAMFLNPDSVFPFQNCGQWNCPVPWKPGITQDTTSSVIAIPNLQADVEAALNRMQAHGYLTSDQVAALEANLTSSGILIPPSGSGRTVPGLPELVLVNNWIMKNFAANIPFGWGMNLYDNNNPLLTPGGFVPSWATASITWLHAVNHSGLSPTEDGWFKRLFTKLFRSNALPTTVPAAVQLEAQKLANYINDLNFAGNQSGQYKPDFIYFDKYERDSIPSYVSSGFAFNGVDLDTMLLYIADTDTLINNIPVAIWQMPGASLQITGATFPNDLADTVVNWTFGVPALNSDFSNINSALNLSGQVFTPYMNTSVYFTKNSNVNNLQQYLQLTNASP